MAFPGSKLFSREEITRGSRTFVNSIIRLQDWLSLFKTTPNRNLAIRNMVIYSKAIPTGRVAQSVTCLATDACLTADPGVMSSIPARSHTFVEIDHEIISTVILLPSADSFKKGCCQLQAKVYAQITG